MKSEIVECVPNFSEGKDKRVINEIVESIDSVKDVKVIHIDSDEDYNRTVITFVGNKKAIIEGAFEGCKKASRIIYMFTQKGEHPRVGATDVVPFVPIRDVSMEDCVEISKKFGKRVGKELNIPVYLYGESTSANHRKNLADIRKGGYEGFAEKINKPEWKPDYGPAIMHSNAGVTVTGARKILIAYNVNLATNDKDIANEIAKRIRESGYTKTDETGNKVEIPGSLKAVKAIGVYLHKYNIAQVSMNLTDFEITPPHIAYEEVKKTASEFGTEVKGSQIIGLVPLKALIMAAKYYSVKQNLSEQQSVNIAAEKLGLSSLTEFNTQNKILEYLI